jgi:delta14-sterol reductase
MTYAPFLWPVAIYAVIFSLHLLMPARHVRGYVTDEKGEPLRYRLNGLPVLFVTVGLWALACRNGLWAWDDFYVHRWAMASGACAMGLLFTVFVVFTAPRVPGWPLLKEIYLGRAANPRWLGERVDAKMLLYLLGAVMLELNLLSFGAHHLRLFPQHPSPGVFLYVALFTFFLIDYLFFEEVHLYTYDFVAENVGFKLGWGCFVFYPFFYAVGLWSMAEVRPNVISWPLEALSLWLFFGGWLLSRGANLQKYWFKRDPHQKAFGVLKPIALTADDGRQVLVSGFWGLSRHINYLGELLMASGLALSLGAPGSLGPWLYPLYYLVLLLPRQLDDDKRCAAKYGTVWTEYRRRVPKRIIPFVY